MALKLSKQHSNELASAFQMCRAGNWAAIERTFRALKRQTSSFSNCFSHVEPEITETWLHAFARWYNPPN